MAVPKLAKHYAQIASAEAGSIAATAIDTSGIVAAQLASNAVETAKIKDGNVTKAKLANQYFACAGTIAGLTAAIGAPAGLVQGAVYVIKDTADSNKIKIVVVQNSAFFIGAALTAAA